MDHSIKAYTKIMTITLTLCLVGMGMSGTAFAERCVDNGNGTVTDNGTGLVWQKNTDQTHDWWGAEKTARHFAPDGHTGWRLPDGQELLGLYDSPCKNLMTVAPYWYWSSTIYAFETGVAIAVNFSGGSYWQARGNGYYVRAVRQVN